ncbi:MAG: metallophosphatase domain-containing protein [Polyangia bacterium]|jgi:Icc-related predicted phosphoesterase|nr:metallophosphatase domain-containing protein [Polyangia bacterium]
MPGPTSQPLCLVLVSDTHGRHAELEMPKGDILLHAGDLTPRGTLAELRATARWLASLPHAHKVVIAGNHDFCLEERPEESRRILEEEGGVTYLLDQEVSLRGLRIWGSPWQPWFYDWAFNLRRGAPIAEKWALIPSGIDVLVTHGPPGGILDRTVSGEAAGCQDLSSAIERTRPRLHLFGHIHEAYGRLTWEGTLYVNASACDLSYRAVQPPVVVTWPPGGTSR